VPNTKCAFLGFLGHMPNLVLYSPLYKLVYTVVQWAFWHDTNFPRQLLHRQGNG